MLVPFETRFAQNVDAAIRKEQQRLRENLGGGSIIHQYPDAATIGLHCAAEISKIMGLQTALDLMQSIHKEMTSSSKKEPKD